MIRIVLSIFFLTFLFAACDNQPKEGKENEEAYVALDKMNIDNLGAEIAKREKALNNDSTAMDLRKAAALMEAYAVYAERFPNRASSAERLFKAGELAMSIKQTVQAIKYLDKVYREYPEFEKRPYAKFLKAFVLENQAQDFEQAKEVYQEFINEYPGHPMADDAEYSIRNMGKSPEELIREFERQDSIRQAQAEA
jgi:outer membrane protein assembly factor BamD (BamD/ComL family)